MGHPHDAATKPHPHAVAVLERPTVIPTPDPHDPHHHRRSLLAFLVPFGAAASPDLTILPLFLAAGALGVIPALAVLSAFAASTIAAIVGLTTATALGAARLTAPWIEKRANTLTAATRLVIGALVVGGVV
jgi:nickel/cobalt exporter